MLNSKKILKFKFTNPVQSQSRSNPSLEIQVVLRKPGSGQEAISMVSCWEKEKAFSLGM